MILKHPLPKDSEKNKLAIEKYKDRLVYVKHKTFNLWCGSNKTWVKKIQRISMTFKDALKMTKNYCENKIEYHFINENLPEENKIDINDFEPEEVHSCIGVTFEKDNK